jgi:polar amino acid transport system substrate-binding protein
MRLFVGNPRARGLGMKIGVGVGLLSMMLSGCSAPAGNGQGGSGEPDSALQKILDRGTLNVGACLSIVPMGIINAKGEPDGFDVDIAKALAKDLGVKLHIEDVTSASRIPSLQSGKVDVISCGFTVNEERKKQIDFSDPVIHNGNSLLVRKDSGIKDVDDLDGKTVAVSKGGTSIAVTKAANPNAKQQPYETVAAATLAVEQGQADAMIDTSSLISAAADKNDELMVANDGGVGPKVDFALGLKKDQPELLERVNAFMKKFHEQGMGTELYLKWYEAEPTYQFEGLED